MNVNALSNIAGGYIQSLLSTATGSLSSSNSAAPTSTSDIGSLLSSSEGSPSLSPFAQVLSTLQQVQQNNPTQYQQLTQQIATNLQNASQQAQASGNTTQASTLSTLANDFQSASTNDQLPNIQDLASALGGGHGGGHHHHFDISQSSSSSSDSSSSSSGSNSSSNSASTQSLLQLLSNFQDNAAASSSLDPMSIIMNTLQSAGVTSNSNSSITSN